MDVKAKPKYTRGIQKKTPKYILGNGKLTKNHERKIHFWFDIWCGDWPLVLYPAIFQLTSDQFAAVSDLFYRPNGMIQWDICLSQEVQDWEIDEVSIFSFLYS